MMLKKADIILISRRNVGKWDYIPFFIQLWTRFRWSHAAIIVEPKTQLCVHATKKGVNAVYFNDIRGDKILCRIDISPYRANKIIKYALNQLNKKFNWLTFMGFADARHNRYGCTELIRDSYLYAGIELNIWKPVDLMYDERFKVYKNIL